MANTRTGAERRPKQRHHGEGSRAFKAKDARRQRPWRCALRLGTDPLTGRPRVKWFSGTSRAEVERERDAYRDTLRRAGSPEAAARTVDALLAGWLARRRPNVDPSTIRTYERAIKHHLSPTLGTRLVVDLTTEDVEAARAAWRNVRPGKKKGTALAPATSNLVLGILRDALGPEVRRRVIPDTTAEVARRRQPPSTARYLTPEQAKTLLEAFKDDDLELLVQIGVAVGMRRGEILGLRWSDLDLEASTWTAGLQLRPIPIEARYPGEGPYRLVEPKAGHAMGRVVVLPAFVVAALTAHRVAWDAKRAKARVWVKPGDLVFCDGNGEALPPNSVTRSFERVAKRALGFHLRLHDLRHSAATIMLASGVDRRVVMDILGHADGRQTDHYTHVVRKLGEDAAGRVNEAIG